MVKICECGISIDDEYEQCYLCLQKKLDKKQDRAIKIDGKKIETTDEKILKDEELKIPMIPSAMWKQATDLMLACKQFVMANFTKEEVDDRNTLINALFIEICKRLRNDKY